MAQSKYLSGKISVLRSRIMSVLPRSEGVDGIGSRSSVRVRVRVRVPEFSLGLGLGLSKGEIFVLSASLKK